SPRCFGLSASSASISFKLKGRASPTSSGSSSEAKLLPPLASESPSLLTAIFLIEHPLIAVIIATTSSHTTESRPDCSSVCPWDAGVCDLIFFSQLSPAEAKDDPERSPAVLQGFAMRAQGDDIHW